MTFFPQHCAQLKVIVLLYTTRFSPTFTALIITTRFLINLFKTINPLDCSHKKENT